MSDPITDTPTADIVDAIEAWLAEHLTYDAFEHTDDRTIATEIARTVMADPTIRKWKARSDAIDNELDRPKVAFGHAHAYGYNHALARLRAITGESGMRKHVVSTTARWTGGYRTAAMLTCTCGWLETLEARHVRVVDVWRVTNNHIYEGDRS